MKDARLRAVRAKAGDWCCLVPSLKAGVNERQSVDDGYRLVLKYLAINRSLKATVNGGRFVYGLCSAFV